MLASTLGFGCGDTAGHGAKDDVGERYEDWHGAGAAHGSDSEATDLALETLRTHGSRTSSPEAVESLCWALSEISSDTLRAIVDHRTADSTEDADARWPIEEMVAAVVRYRELHPAALERSTIAHLLSTGNSRDLLEGVRFIGAQPDLKVVRRAAITLSRSRRADFRAAAGRLAGIVSAFGGGSDATDRVISNLLIDKDPRVAYLTGVHIAFETRRPRVFDALFECVDDDREIADTELPWFVGAEVAGERVGDQIRLWTLGRLEEIAFSPWLEQHPPLDQTAGSLQSWWKAEKAGFPFSPEDEAWVEDLNVVDPDIQIGVERQLGDHAVHVTVVRCEESWRHGVPVTSALLDIAYEVGDAGFQREVGYRAASDAWTGRSTFGNKSGARLVHYRVQRLVNGRCRLLLQIWRRR